MASLKERDNLKKKYQLKEEGFYEVRRLEDL